MIKWKFVTPHNVAALMIYMQESQLFIGADVGKRPQKERSLTHLVAPLWSVPVAVLQWMNEPSGFFVHQTAINYRLFTTEGSEANKHVFVPQFSSYYQCNGQALCSFMV